MNIENEETNLYLQAASHGDKKKVKKYLEKGVEADSSDECGRTALYVACEGGHEGSVSLLLKYGANPNRKTKGGATAVHAAARSGNVKLISTVIQGGGDVRLHDSNSATVENWANECIDEKKKKRMLEYLKKLKLFAISYHVINQTGETNTLSSLQRWKKESCSYWNVVKGFNHFELDGLPYICNYGYGTICVGLGDDRGSVGYSPLVAEKSLGHDEYGCTYNNGPFVVMESMKWDTTRVTVKRLHKFPPKGGYIDLLIKESEYMLKLKHPNILLLMGICQTISLDGIVLLYERVNYASLYTSLYTKAESMNSYNMCEVLIQISEAVSFLHQCKLLHCYVTSHAIQMVSRNYAKLSNFEYMVKSSDIEKGIGRTEVTENRYTNAAYNWMAPEIMAELPPSSKSDLYSLTCVMWEIINGMPPWSGLDAGDIELELLRNGNSVPVPHTIQNPFHCLLEYGLAVDPSLRQLSVLQLRDVLHSYLLDEDSKVTRQVAPSLQRQYNSERKSTGDYLTAVDHSATDEDEKLISDKACGEHVTTYSKNRVELQEDSFESDNEYQTAPEVLGVEQDLLKPPEVDVKSDSVRDIGKHLETDSDNVHDTDLEEEIKIVVEEIENVAEQEQIKDCIKSESVIQEASVTEDTGDCKNGASILHKDVSVGTEDAGQETSQNISDTGTSSKSKFSFRKMFSRRSSEQESSPIHTQSGDTKDELTPSKKKVKKKKSSSKKKSRTIKESSDDQSQPEFRYINDTAKRAFFQGKLSRFRSSKNKGDDSPLPGETGTEQKNSCEPIQINCKSTPTSHPVNKRLSHYKMDLSGIGKLDTDSSQAQSDQSETKKLEEKKLEHLKEKDQQQKANTEQREKQPIVDKDGNPFKKYLNLKYDDIITDEIQAILSKPMTMPKLPSQYSTLSLYSRRSIEKKPPSMAEALIKLYPSPTKPVHLISPVKALGAQASPSKKLLSPVTAGYRSSSPRKYQTLPAQTSAVTLITSPLALHNKSCSSFGSSYLNESMDSVVKPASHHVPEKSPRSTEHIAHYAFPRSPRNLTQPGNVTLSMQSVRLNDGRGSYVYGTEKRGVVPRLQLDESANVRSCETGHTTSGSQTSTAVMPRQIYSRQVSSSTLQVVKPTSSSLEQIDLSGKRNGPESQSKLHYTSSTSEYRPTLNRDYAISDGKLTGRDSMLKQATSLRKETSQQQLSPRDKFFRGDDHFRSETLLTVTSQPTASKPRSFQTRTSDIQENRSSPTSLRDSLMRSRFTDKARVIDGTKKSVKNITAAFQQKLEDHMEKQANLIVKRTCHEAMKPTYSSDTFFTPQHLRQQMVPPRLMQPSQVYHAIEGEKQRLVTRASIQLQKQLQNSHYTPEKTEKDDLNFDLSPAVCSRNTSFNEAHNCSLQEHKAVRSSRSSTDEEVSRFIEDPMTRCLQDVLREYVHPQCPHKSPGNKDCSIDATETAKTDAGSASPRENLQPNSNNSNTGSGCVHVGSSGSSCDSATVHNGHYGRRSRTSDESNASKKTDTEIEDIYFDDVINPDLCRDRYMRLQTTMTLDPSSALNTPSMTSILDPNGKPLYSAKKVSPVADFVPVYDIETPNYPQNAVSSSRFKSSRKITKLTEDETDDPQDGYSNYGNEDAVDV